MENLLFLLFIGCIISVPVACFAVAALYSRAGFVGAWTMALNILGGAGILGAISLFRVFSGNQSSQTGTAIILGAAVLVTVAAVNLALKGWPVTSEKSEK